MNVLLFAICGGLGAICRDRVDRFVGTVAPGVFPWGILFVNACGSVLLGVLAGSFDGSDPLLFYIGFGFLGSFTTFSTWMYQSVLLGMEKGVKLAIVNVVAMIFIGFGFAGIGLLIARIVT